MTAAQPVRSTRRSAPPIRPLARPAFWLLTGLLVACGVRLFGILEIAYSRFPTATLTAIASFALLAVPFWLFIISMDALERAPAFPLATAFAWGAVVATTVSIPGNQAVHGVLSKLVSPEFAVAWGSAIAGPTVEELVKGLGVIMIGLIARTHVRSVLDGMVYGALVGLGFRVVEDVVYAVNAVAVAGRGDEVGPVIETVFLRGFLAGLWSHTIFSALTGGGIAYFLVYRERSMARRLAAASIGFGGAWLLHFLWNSPLLADGIGGGAGGVVLGLLVKGVPALVLVLGLARLARVREARVLRYSRQAVLRARTRAASFGIADALPVARRRGKALWQGLAALFVAALVYAAVRALAGS